MTRAATQLLSTAPSATTGRDTLQTQSMLRELGFEWNLRTSRPALRDGCRPDIACSNARRETATRLIYQMGMLAVA